MAFSAHVVYFVPEIGAFLDALERHARRLCVVVAGDPAGPTPYPDQWEVVHTEPYAALPALRELIALLGARGRRFEVRSIEASAAELRPAPSLEGAMATLRRLLLTRPGSEKDRRLRALIAERYTNPDGSVRTGTAMARAAVVSWPPPAPPP